MENNNNQALVETSSKKEGFFSKLGNLFKNLFSNNKKDTLTNNVNPQIFIDQKKQALSDFSLLSSVLKNEISVSNLHEDEAARLCMLCKKRISIIDQKLNESIINFNSSNNQIKTLKQTYINNDVQNNNVSN